MSLEQIKEMADKAMQILYTALNEGKIVTSQGVCQLIDTIHTYQKIIKSGESEKSSVDYI